MNVVGQTLFLGASVVSFSSNIGWGGSNSSVTVELIEDYQPFGRAPFRKFNQSKSADYSELDLEGDNPLPKNHPGDRELTNNFYDINFYNPISYPDNHYYECSGDDCYIDEKGQPYSTSSTKLEKNVPGKIYYEWVNNRFVSKYWYGEDPGFFATGTRINPDGVYEASLGRDPLASNLYIYDIVNTPVYFKFDNFEFIGLIRNWERSNRPGGITYSVTIESFNSLLDNCYVILDKYAGSIFGKQNGYKGTPINNVNTELFTYDGLLREGNIPNIFNVYGFLESFGLDFFGGSNYNDQGISAVSVLQALSALTSSHNRLDRDFAYSPFGRILSKTIARDNGSVCPNLYNFGVISPSVGTQRFPLNAPLERHNAFSLDLSDIGRLIPEYRISGSKSISDLLRDVTEASGTDYTIRVIPAMVDNSLYQFVIKVISVDRTSYRSPYNIRSIVTELENNNYNISTSSFGQEANDNITNKFIIGGPQQRLLQVKNYRLSYNQTNYVYHPILKRFINLNKPWNKARVPDLNSTRHPIISNLTLGGYIGDRININDTTRNVRFSVLDNSWKDIEVSAINRSEETIKGNYNNSASFSSPFYSYIATQDDLNTDTTSSVPDIPCDQQVTWDRLREQDRIETHMPDDTCFYYVKGVACPEIRIDSDGSDQCSANPGQPGGREWLTDANQDEIADFAEGGFVPVTGYESTNSRYLNLHNDWICPYFGRALEQKMPVADDTNEYRSVRPVFLDLWTNQIVVGFSMHELPQLSIGEPLSLYDQSIFNQGNLFNTVTNGLSRGSATGSDGRASNNPTRNGVAVDQPSGTDQESEYWSPLNTDKPRTYVYGAPGFVITESEMRAASVSFDSYFSYCLGKSRYSKPDLFLMLLSAYANKGELIANLDQYFELGDLEKGGGLTRNQGVGAVAQTNVVFNNIPTNPNGVPMSNMNMNWNMLVNHNFIKDLQIICEFIKNIADTYYGKQYLVKLPDMVLYRDRQYASISIPASFSNISVYTGSQKMFYNYQLAEGAWEEPGNFIDDCIVVGDNFSKVFTNDQGLLSPIVGYNNSLNIDDVRQKWCQTDATARIHALFGDANNEKGQALFDILIDASAEIIRILEAIASGNLPNAQISVYEDRIRELLSEEGITQAIELLAQKELQHFGTTLNCLSSSTKIRIQETWNAMWSSLHSSLDNFLRDPTLAGFAQLADQWSQFIDNARNSALDVVNLNLLQFNVPSLDISGLAGNEDFVIVPVSSKTEPFGRQSPRSSKLFSKCLADRIVFMNLVNFTDPRAIMTLNNKLSVFDSSLSYSKDPGISVISNIAIEDSALYIRIKNRLNATRQERNEALFRGDNAKAEQLLNSIKILSKEVDYIRMLKGYIVPEIDPRYLVTTGPSANPSVNQTLMSPRAAHPHFFGIPLTSNQFCYGPWTNYADNVVPAPYIDNLIHKVSVEQNNDLVPWNYGGSSALDTAVGYQLNSDVNYQTVLENGRISIVGPPLFGLGGVFHNDPSRIVSGSFKFDNSWYKPYYAPYKFFDTKKNGYRELQYDCIKLVHREVNFNGPLISNISIQVGSEGLTTSYSFQTYNPKTGLYNKTYENAIKKMAEDRNKVQKAISNIQKSIDSKLLSESNNILSKAKIDRFPQEVSKYKTSLYGQSPIEIFVGQGIESLKNPIWHDSLKDYNILDPGDHPLPNENDKNKFLNQKRQYSWIGGVMGIEIGAELQQEYNSKAAMSLDGILSPVSLYPTKANRTYSISTYVAGSGVPVGSINTDTSCPYCYNKRFITIPYVDYYNNNSDSVQPEDIKIPCPVCSRAKISVQKTDKNPDRETGLPDINVYSLNPIVVSSGEFRNPYASGTDRCRHSIGVVSRGEYNPLDESLYINTNINTYRNGHNPDFARFDTKVKELENLNVLLNQRFMAFRGPLVLHGWGYDTEGYPVPNLLDMPLKLDDKGRPLRFKIDSNPDSKNFGGNNLNEAGRYIPEEEATEPLGDIITTKYSWSGTGDGTGASDKGKWNKKNKLSKKFYLNWAERQDTWPVGPIDLRWDDKRKVWDASGGGCKEEVLPPFIISDKNDLSTLSEFLANRTDNKCPYKMVYLTLEQDMVREDNFESTRPARGFIDDIEYSKEPLQNTYRRLVYIIDITGYTAPRGTKLLCRYNKDTGFYEPVTKPIVTALGNITGRQARIQMSYSQARRAGVVPSYVYAFDNPLELTPGAKGLFSYIDGKWTLISTG
jgi:hypothetical protein